MVRLWPYLLATLGACYRPGADEACAISCASAACPSGLACGADQKCYSPGGPQCNAIPDAPMIPPTIDAPPDVATKVCDGMMYGQGMLSVCIDAPLGSLTLGSQTQSTDGLGSPTPCTQILYPAGAPQVCVIAAQSLGISGTLRATGTRSLLLLGTQTLLIGSSGVIDVSSTSGSPGAGAVFACVPEASPGTPNTSGLTAGAGGGAGGRYGGGGGAGGASDTYTGGSASQSVALTAVRGGCAGGSGGSTVGTAGGVPGVGGGAVYLMGGSITIAGTINASGGGGEAETGNYAGGGGGGAGGFIGLDGSSYLLDGATLYAIGGGGSSGAASSGGSVAGDTASGPMMTAIANPMNGAGAGAAGNSGDGYTGDPGVCGSECAGGGGGGGGGGYIAIYNLAALGNTTAVIAPAAVPMP